MVSRLQLLGISAAEESRVYTNRGYSIEDMKSIGNTPGWLLQHDKRGPADTTAEAKAMEEEEQDRLDVSNVSDGRFGPRTAGLNMPLPSAYPSMAGLAKEALKANLKKDEKAKKKIAKKRIPDPAEAVRMKEEEDKKSLFQTPQWLLKRRKKQELAAASEVDVGINIMLNSGYPAGRRQSLGTLPGMSKHYPNSGYVNRARLPAGYQEPKEQQNLFQSLFKKKKKNTKNGAGVLIAPPVGRKPLESCSQFRGITAESKEVGDDDSAVGAVSNDSVFPFLAPGGEESIASVASPTTRVGSADGDPSRRQSMSLAGSSAVSVDGGGASGTRRSSVKPDDSASESKEARRGSVGSVAGSTITGRPSTRHSERIDAPLDDGAKPEELVMATFAGRHSRVPKGVYLERRGSFTVAPGLESFSTYLEDKKDSIRSIKYDEFGRVLGKGKRAESTAVMPRREIKATGLIRVMHTNVRDFCFCYGLL